MNVRRVRPIFVFTISVAIVIVISAIRKLVEYNNYIIKRPNSFQTVEYLAKRNMRKNVRIINLWTEFNHDKFKYINRVKGHLQTCPLMCQVTDNPKRLMDSDAVFFHLTDIWIPNWEIGTKRTIPFPDVSDPNQVWIIHNSEPPSNLFGDVNIFGEIFNWTMWYRSDATIFDPYGRYVYLEKFEKEDVSNRYEKRSIYSEKSKFMVGAINNCNEPARRYLLIHEMSKYIDIEMFGKCYGNRKCLTSLSDGYTDCDEELKQYRFYIAFESNYCSDYITEKYWNALAREQIPVVNWKHMDILSGYVPKSFINVYDFLSVKEFTDYIKLVNSNETLYNSYFEWRKTFTIDLTGGKPWCDLCEKLHSMHEASKPEMVDFRSYINSDVCPSTTKESSIAELKARYDFLARKELV